MNLHLMETNHLAVVVEGAARLAAHLHHNHQMMTTQTKEMAEGAASLAAHLLHLLQVMMGLVSFWVVSATILAWIGALATQKFTRTKISYPSNVQPSRQTVPERVRSGTVSRPNYQQLIGPTKIG